MEERQKLQNELEYDLHWIYEEDIMGEIIRFDKIDEVLKRVEWSSKIATMLHGEDNELSKNLNELAYLINENWSLEIKDGDLMTEFLDHERHILEAVEAMHGDIAKEIAFAESEHAKYHDIIQEQITKNEEKLEEQIEKTRDVIENLPEAVKVNQALRFGQAEINRPR